MSLSPKDTVGGPVMSGAAAAAGMEPEVIPELSTVTPCFPESAFDLV